jgi:hypothetical protein
MLGIDRNELYWKFFLLNCYISVIEYPDLKNHFFLLFKFKNKDSYLAVKEKLLQSKLYKEERKHTTKSGDYYIFVFNVPQERKKDVALFKLGKYSQISREFKNMIFKVHSVTQEKPLFHILNRSKMRRIKLSNDLDYDIPEDLDLWTVPHDHEETLTLKDLK